MKFQVGQTYEARSVADIEVRWAFEVVSRSPKMITVLERHLDKPKRVKVHTSPNGSEWALPLGRFSMAPVISAAK